MPVEAHAYPRPLPDPEWLGKRTEEILEPGLPIVDPHHHLWDHPGSRHLLDELLADVNSGHTSSRPSSSNAVRAIAPAGPRKCERSAKANSSGRLPRKATGAVARPRFAPASSASPICGCLMSMRSSKDRSPPQAAGSDYTEPKNMQELTVNRGSAHYPSGRDTGNRHLARSQPNAQPLRRRGHDGKRQTSRRAGGGR